VEEKRYTKALYVCYFEGNTKMFVYPSPSISPSHCFVIVFSLTTATAHYRSNIGCG
jgi:hypothetical protein